MSTQYTDAAGSYNASALTGYGLNRVYAASSATNGGVQAVSERMVVFTLTGGPVGTPVDLLVELGYDVTVSTSGRSSAGFRMVVNGDTFTPFDIATTGDPFGSDHASIGLARLPLALAREGTRERQVV